ncbi:MAG TPA: DUF4239 domain-containing protein [Oculatellaceae cyanobacterium]
MTTRNGCYNSSVAIDSYGAGGLIVLLTALLAVGALSLLRKLMPKESLRASHDVSGYLLSIIGTMYAVLLGLVVVDAMSKFQEARNNVQAEANALADVFLLSERFPEAKEKQIKTLCLHYVERVVDVEWKMMDDGLIDMESRRTAINLMRAVQEIEPKGEAEVAVYPMAVQQVCQLWDCRRSRTNTAQFGVPGEEWLVLLIGGAITIGFVCLFTIESVALQTTMTVMVSVLISLNLLLVLWFGYPFSGDRKVHPDPFKVDKKVFDNQFGHLHDQINSKG